MNILSRLALVALLPTVLFYANSCADSGDTDSASSGGKGDSGGSSGASNQDCQIGADGCRCTAGGACDAGLACVDETCVQQSKSTGGSGGAAVGGNSGSGSTCQVGSEGCACTAGGACDAGLSCASKLCVSLDGVGGGTNQPSGGTAGTTGGTTGSGGFLAIGGAAGNHGGPSHCLNQNVNHSPGGTHEGTFFMTDTSRNGIPYFFFSGDVGGGFLSQTLHYAGASFEFEGLSGSGSQNNPVVTPLVLCGELDAEFEILSKPGCGLPISLGQATKVDFGARFSHTGEGWDFSYGVVINALDNSDESIWVSVSLRVSESYDFGDNAIIGQVQIGKDPEEWNVTYQEGNRHVHFYRSVGEEHTEYAGDALTFVQYANETYDVGIAELLGLWGTTTVYYGPITNLSLEDFCVEAE